MAILTSGDFVKNNDDVNRTIESIIEVVKEDGAYRYYDENIQDIRSVLQFAMGRILSVSRSLTDYPTLPSGEVSVDDMVAYASTPILSKSDRYRMILDDTHKIITRCLWLLVSDGYDIGKKNEMNKSKSSGEHVESEEHEASEDRAESEEHEASEDRAESEEHEVSEDRAESEDHDVSDDRAEFEEHVDIADGSDDDDMFIGPDEDDAFKKTELSDVFWKPEDDMLNNFMDCSDEDEP